MQSVVIATVLGLSDKYVRKEYIDRPKEVVRMTRIGAALIEEGRIEGKIEGRKEAVLNAIKAKFDTIPDDLKEKVIKIDNEEKFDELLIAVIKSNSIDEIYKMI
ncbi:MAG: hypothetical protein QME46_01855 [Thermoanaerobacteraceae bacterium]|nr:hypothetical protein [Thermoanaerobacteraceae bacterium]